MSYVWHLTSQVTVLNAVLAVASFALPPFLVVSLDHRRQRESQVFSLDLMSGHQDKRECISIEI